MKNPITKPQPKALSETEDMQKRIEALAEMAKKREQEGQPVQQSCKIVQLPMWPDSVRAVPNVCLRSALFSAIRKGRRRYMETAPVAALDGILILYTGQRLDQGDLDVWEQCLHLARTAELGMRVQFSAHGFLRNIGRSTGKSQHEWLKMSLRRLMTALVEIQEGKRTYAGQLIHHWTRDDNTGHHVVVLNPAIVKLYDKDSWTQLEWSLRMELKGQPLAQWLHGFYATHADPFPIKVETLHRLCGSEAVRLRDYRSELREALIHLNKVTGWIWEIDPDDRVHLKKIKAKQARRLIRHSTRAGTA